MTDLRKAAEMALKFCEDIGELGGPYPYVNETAIVSDSRKVLQALRQALTQPEQEPVAWITDGGKGELWWYQSSKYDEEGNLIGYNPDDVPLYTTPPNREWVGLTDEEMSELANEYKHIETGWYHDMDLISKVEAKLKEKNT